MQAMYVSEYLLQSLPLLCAVETRHSTEVEGVTREGLKEVPAQPDHQPADPDGKVRECLYTCVRLHPLVPLNTRKLNTTDKLILVMSTLPT